MEDLKTIIMLKALLVITSLLTHSSASSILSTPTSKSSLPNWDVTYDMAQSTTIMPCNFSGHYDFEAYPALGKFGLVDYDWSNAKQEWVNGQVRMMRRD